MTPALAEAHIRNLLVRTPQTALDSPYSAPSAETNDPVASSQPDLDLPDEFAARNLLLGVYHREAGHFSEARAFLTAATRVTGVVGRGIINSAHFELAVLELQAVELDAGAKEWEVACQSAEKHLKAASSATNPNGIAFVSVPLSGGFVA